MICSGDIKNLDFVKTLSTKKYLRKQKRNTVISRRLNTEIEKTQKLLAVLYKRKHNRVKRFNRIQASEFIAQFHSRHRLALLKKK